MTFTHFTAGIDDSDRRLDRVLRKFLSEESLSSLYKSLRKGLIKVNGKKCEGNFRISNGDDIQIADFLLTEKANEKSSDNKNSSPILKRAKIDLEKITVFKNESLLILNKPYDIPVQPSSSQGRLFLSEIVQEEYENTHKKSSLSFRTGPLHRLDRKTTGLIAFSQNLEGAKWFSEAIKTHTIQKEYLALLEGKFEAETVWEDMIQKLESGQQKFENERFHTVSVNSEDGKFAHTEVFPVSHAVFNGNEVTLARVLITTGRTHQIRSQCAYHGFPLLGDTAYGGTKIDSKKFAQDFFLHAFELHFPADNPLGLPEKLNAPISKAAEDFFSSINLVF
ncbi:RluA family pseudouridine synthase [uncultured Treponema sp.]|uniref:RluA family pseudouridine synthase n=1 Tax=uncultured Treponema sp. TaxID=162155 RepID=UPI0025D299CD|nr:RluA family pseudouridine synthase [uncultured Treponema sp.]